MGRRGRAGEVVNLIDLEFVWIADIVPDQLKARISQQVLNIPLPSGEEIIEAEDLMPFVQEPFTEMGAEEAGTAGNENAHGGGGR